MIGRLREKMINRLQTYFRSNQKSISLFYLHTRAPLTRDFLRIGMASYVMDTSRMKAELLPVLQYSTLDQGIRLL